MAFLLLTCCCALLCNINLTSGFPTGAPSCPEGQVWDSHLKACFNCAICEGYPETPLCTSCKSTSALNSGPQKVSVVPSTNEGTTRSHTTCENGYAWDDFLRRCVDCAVCKTHPDTPLCRECPRTEAPDGLRSDAPPVLAAVLTSVAVCLIAGLVGVAVWVKYGPGCCGRGQKERQFPEVEPGKTARGYKVEYDSGCSSMGSSYASIALLTMDKVTVV